MLDLFKRIRESRTTLAGGQKDNTDAAASEGTDADKPLSLTLLYSFSTLNHVIRLAHVLDGIYHGSNFLYKDNTSGRYILLVTNGSHTPEEFNRLCNCLSEYGRQEKSVPGQEAFLEEHCELILAGNALQSLNKV